VLHAEVVGGATLTLGLSVALLWSGLAPASYRTTVFHHFSSHALQSWGLGSLHELVINGLMTLFFFAVGLELSREIRVGQLRDIRRAVLPVWAALGGMVATAMLMHIVGWLAHSPAMRSAWGVPMATDIAFALGVLALAGPRIPKQLRLFLLTLAVADDIFSVIALALTGPHAPSAAWLGGALALGAGVWSVSRRIPPLLWWLALVGMWALFTKAGVEPSLAGVALGVLAPFQGDRSAGHRLEPVVMVTSNWAVLPLFAIIAVGIDWTAFTWSEGAVHYGIALATARVVGKVVGITGIIALARRAGLESQSTLSLSMYAAMSLLCAVGFTVPLLFAGNVFSSGGPLYSMTTLALLVASALSGLLGVWWLRHLSTRHVAE